jgi:hypothetical protein
MASNAELISDRGKWGDSKPGSLPVRVAKRQRRHMFDRFLRSLSPTSDDASSTSV